jgi:NAD+ kinase
MATRRILLVGSREKAQVASVAQQISSWLSERGDIVEMVWLEDKPSNAVQAQLAVVLGGDGTILNAARWLGSSEVPIVGVNIGKLGFLAEFSVNELKEYWPDICAQRCRVVERMTLDCEICGQTDEIFRQRAINDLVITAGDPFRMIELKMRLGSSEAGGIAGDGLIISTPTGSTAYNMSAGGPIVDPQIKAIIVTPICAHSLNHRPLVVSCENEIGIIAQRVNEGTSIILDGQISRGFSVGQELKVRRGKHSLYVVASPARDHWGTLGAKLHWAKGPRYSQ